MYLVTFIACFKAFNWNLASSPCCNVIGLKNDEMGLRNSRTINDLDKESSPQRVLVHADDIRIMLPFKCFD